MNNILLIIKKEFLQVFRNKAMIPLIFFMPLVQLLILSNAATYEIKNIYFSTVDLDNSSFSRDLISRFSRNGYFILKESCYSVENAEQSFRNNETRLILVIPEKFERNLLIENKTKIQLIINAEDGAAAGVINTYAQSIIQQFNADVISETFYSDASVTSPVISVNFMNWFNPKLDYKTYMVPGILVVLITFIGTFLTGMSIVREKEIGTIEQLNVTPISKGQFITGKLIPFWIIAMAELAFGLLTGALVFGVPMVGNPLLIFLTASVYLITVLGIGLLISTVTETQQQSMFISWFFMVLFLLMGGVFTPVESMPNWAQNIAYFNPVSQFIKAMRMIMLKGSGLFDIINILIYFLIYGVIIMTLAIVRFRKREL